MNPLKGPLHLPKSRALTQEQEQETTRDMSDGKHLVRAERTKFKTV